MAAHPVRKQNATARWINVLLRTVHLLAVVALAARVLTGQADAPGTHSIAVVVVISGVTMFVLDFLRNPSHLREVAGVGVVLKIAMCIWMVLQPALLVPIFWALLLVSSLISHAPKNFRHHVWLPRTN